MFIPWNLATLAGVLLGGAIPDPSRFGLDIVFPAAMAGLAVGLATGRREVVAAGAGAAIGVVLSLLDRAGDGDRRRRAARAAGRDGGAGRRPAPSIAPDSDVTGAAGGPDEAIAEVDELRCRAGDGAAP